MGSERRRSERRLSGDDSPHRRSHRRGSDDDSPLRREKSRSDTRRRQNGSDSSPRHHRDRERETLPPPPPLPDASAGRTGRQSDRRGSSDEDSDPRRYDHGSKRRMSSDSEDDSPRRREKPRGDPGRSIPHRRERNRIEETRPRAESMKEEETLPPPPPLPKAIAGSTARKIDRRASSDEDNNHDRKRSISSDDEDGIPQRREKPRGDTHRSDDEDGSPCRREKPRGDIRRHGERERDSFRRQDRNKHGEDRNKHGEEARMSREATKKEEVLPPPPPLPGVITGKTAWQTDRQDYSDEDSDPRRHHHGRKRSRSTDEEDGSPHRRKKSGGDTHHLRDGSPRRRERNNHDEELRPRVEATKKETLPPPPPLPVVIAGKGSSDEDSDPKRHDRCRKHAMSTDDEDESPRRREKPSRRKKHAMSTDDEDESPRRREKPSRRRKHAMSTDDEDGSPRRREKPRGDTRRRREKERSSPPQRRRNKHTEEARARDEATKREESLPPPPPLPPMPDANGGRSGGIYIPPFRMAQMMKDVQDKSSEAYQRLSWDALRKSINGLVNKVNSTNIKNIIPELFSENLIRGRGLFCRSCMKSQMASPGFTDVFSALVAVVNTKFPEVGKLLLNRIVLQLKRAYKRNDKPQLLAATKFIAHLVNQQAAHEIVALELLTVLLENPTVDSVEVAVGFVKECGALLQDFSPKGLHGIFERFRGILHEGEIEKRVGYLIEELFAIRKAKFQGFPAIRPELDLVEQEDQFTHEISLEDEIDPETNLDVFRPNPNFLEDEKAYEELKRSILPAESSEDDEGDSDAASDDESEDDSEDEEEEKMQIKDETETNLVNLRRTIYLTIMSSVDFEEAGHKLLKIKLEPGQEMELCIMLLECCSQERTYLRYYGLLGQRFCMINRVHQENFEKCFVQQYSMIHRLETNKLRNVAKFFAHLLGTSALPWNVLSYIRLTEEDTTSSSRIFIKILFQELSEHLGIRLLNERLNDPTMQDSFDSIFPKDNPKNTRFSINFFTSIGLGGITESLREYLKNMPRLIMQQQKPVSESDDDSGNSSASSSGSSSSDSDTGSDSDSESSSDESDRKKRSSKRRRK